jgi:hypothetical protein
MRRSILAFMAAASVVGFSTPAVAGKSNIQTLPAVTNPCDVGLTTPDAIDCAGYYPQNWNAGSPQQIALTQEAIASLDGDFEWDGDWNAVSGSTQLAADLGGPNDDQLSFGQTLFGLTVIGAHFGNVAGPAGNVSVFWLFDFGTEGADFITLDNTGGFSNAVLYTTGGTPPVPEPATWAMMLLGFGAAGTAMRRNRRRTAHIAQLA